LPYQDVLTRFPLPPCAELDTGDIFQIEFLGFKEEANYMRLRNPMRIPFLIALVTAFSLSFTSMAVAQDWKFHAIVDVDFVKQYVKIPAPKGVMIVDSRPTKLRYDKGHIPNAVNIPDSQFDKFKHLLPADKSTLLIFYCQGPT
jgi:rhodanese-like protein